MKPDTLIKTEGMNILTKHLGLVDAERFVMLMNREASDYTKWQENLFEGMTIEEIYTAAADLRNKMKNK
jgi:hypothetical protein